MVERVVASRGIEPEDDVRAIIGTVIETRDDVRWLKRAVQALLDHDGVSIDDRAAEGDA